MTISTMRTLVRRDLKDEDAQNYRWTNDEIDRAITRALEDLSHAIPREMKSTVATTNGSAIIDISGVSGIANLISIDKVEFPVDETTAQFRRFTLYQSTIALIDGYTGNGGNCYVYWSSLHTLDSQTCTVPARFLSLLATGAAAYATMAQAQYHSDRANTGGENVDRDYALWGKEWMHQFQNGLQLHGRRARVRQAKLYVDDKQENL
ncbi:MAG: hypothetical protein FJ015_07335 [Chloroflexi bacterium]|nr:hypothetical protein [Chloroflexota bacterium]